MVKRTCNPCNEDIEAGKSVVHIKPAIQHVQDQLVSTTKRIQGTATKYKENTHDC